MRICLVQKCGAKHYAKDVCRKHYKKLVKYGDPNVSKVGRHGLEKSPEYETWGGMKRRCNNPTRRDYKFYGGRGISVCQRWLGPSGFVNFYGDMGQRPSSRHSIDRIDSNGDYSPENCRWATKLVQANNTRSNKFITIGDRCMTIAQWIRETGVNVSTFEGRYYERNMPIEKALGL